MQTGTGGLQNEELERSRQKETRIRRKFGKCGSSPTGCDGAGSNRPRAPAPSRGFPTAKSQLSGGPLAGASLLIGDPTPYQKDTDESKEESCDFHQFRPEELTGGKIDAVVDRYVSYVPNR